MAAAAAVSAAFAFPQALYVKQGETVTKYNFGVARDLNFSNNGKTLTITGYRDVIDLDKVDYISFSAPVDASALTPSAQKQKMVEIGEAANAKIDLKRHSDLLNMWHVFFDDIRDSQGWHAAPSTFGFASDDDDMRKALNGIVRATSQMVKGNAAAARTFKAKAVDLYKVSDCFGIFTANREKEEWEKTSDADYLEIRFNALNGEEYSVRLTASEDYTTWETKDFNSQLPRTMTVAFNKGTNTFATAIIKSEIVQDQKIAMDLEFTSNGYVVMNKMLVTDSAITDDVLVTIDGEAFLTANTDIAGKNLVNYDSMYSAIKETTHYHDENDECCGEDPHELLAHFIRATSDVDLMGKLQAKGKISGLTKIYDALAEDDYVFDEYVKDNLHIWTYGKVIGSKNGTYDITHTDSSITEKHLQFLNNYVDATFHYDGDKQIQGYISWDLNEDVEESGTWQSDTDGYTIVDGYLVSVWRNKDYNYTPSGEEVITYGDWKYSASYEENDEYDYREITVDDKDVFNPETLRRFYYEKAPLLVFPDLTSFSFEDFFDEVSFKALIDDYNDIIDTYLNITGQEKDGDRY